MSKAYDRYTALLDTLARQAEALHRPPPLLLAVSKTRSADEIRDVFDAGCRDFGENYLQEALDKRPPLAGLPITWHFIGPIQSNKTRAIAEHFDWVHGIDRLKIAQRLNDQRPVGRDPLNVCIQVNIDDEDSKSGIPLAEVPALAAAVAELPRLRLRGLMCIPAPQDDEAARHHPFALLRNARDALAARGLAMDTLSMGMSDDLEAAIAEGSTLVRVGTALFGPRPPHSPPSHQGTP